MGLEVVDELVEIVGQRPYYASSYPAWILNCSNNIIKGQLKDFGNKNTWSTWPHHSLSSNHDREGLQIVKLCLIVSIVVHASIKFKLKNMGKGEFT